MILDITELEPNNPIDIEIDEDFEELNAHATGMLNVKMTGNFVFIKGDLDVNIELECSRCLKKFEEVLNVNIDEKFFKGSYSPVKSKEHQMKAADFAEELNNSDEIDLRDLIYQSIIINVPAQALCDENCEGLEELKNYIKADENIQTIEISLKMNNKDNNN
ncbi:MAG: YceD family protein [Candidatus Gastranaerophilales bacterium]|nr:YceD family protein [Candidatus Gastranaerophilales bacterium]